MLPLLLGAGATLGDVTGVPRDETNESAWLYVDKINESGGYAAHVQKLRKVFLGGTTKEGEYSPGAIRKLRSHEGRRLPYDVAALVLSFWMPPGGY